MDWCIGDATVMEAPPQSPRPEALDNRLLCLYSAGPVCLISDGAVERLFLSLTVKTNAIKKAKAILSKTPIKGLFIILLQVSSKKYGH